MRYSYLLHSSCTDNLKNHVRGILHIFSSMLQSKEGRIYFGPEVKEERKKQMAVTYTKVLGALSGWVTRSGYTLVGVN